MGTLCSNIASLLSKAGLHRSINQTVSGIITMSPRGMSLNIDTNVENQSARYRLEGPISPSVLRHLWNL